MRGSSGHSRPNDAGVAAWCAGGDAAGDVGDDGMMSAAWAISNASIASVRSAAVLVCTPSGREGGKSARSAANASPLALSWLAAPRSLMAAAEPSAAKPSSALSSEVDPASGRSLERSSSRGSNRSRPASTCVPSRRSPYVRSTQHAACSSSDSPKGDALALYRQRPSGTLAETQPAAASSAAIWSSRRAECTKAEPRTSRHAPHRGVVV